MLIKNKIDFLTFNSGIIKIFEIDENGMPIKETAQNFRYGNKTVGVKRYFSARQNDIEIAKVVYIHYSESITTGHIAAIKDTLYKIEQVQHIADSNPRSTVLTLSQRGLYDGGFGDV